MFQLNYFLLNILRYLSEHNIVMAPVLIDAKLAIEDFINLAAVLNLLILMLLAEELSGIVVEVLDFVQNILLKTFFLRLRLKLLKGFHGVVVLILPCW